MFSILLRKNSMQDEYGRYLGTEKDFEVEEMEKAVANGRRNSLKKMCTESPRWFKILCNDKIYESKICEIAANHGRKEILQWLWSEKLINQEVCRRHAVQMLINAARNGHYQVIEWLIQNGVIDMGSCLSVSCSVISNAAGTGQIAVLEWMKKTGWASAAHCRMRNNEALKYALICEQIAAADWLMAQGLDHKDCEYLSDLVHIVVGAKTTAVVDWLLRRRLMPPKFYERIRDASNLVWRKKTDLLDWLWQNRLLTKEHCLSDDFVFEAAERGNLEMLQWLKNAVPEINLRAQNFKALRIAATKCHVETAKWFAKESAAKLSDFYSADVLRSVCNSVPMLEWLLSCGGCATEDFDEVLRFPAKLINLKWIAQHTDLSLFKKYGMEQIWRDAQQSQLLLKTLVLVAAGRRNKVRQPSPELWEHIVREYC